MNYEAQAVSDYLVMDGREFKGTDQMGKLCRELKQGTLHVYRDGKISMTVDIAKRAEKSLSENDKNGLRYVKYTPFPDKLFNPPN
jgi:hypothetical protein